jgi:modulator of FtsH protease
MNATDWNDLFVASAGAGAALAGLIIVAMSVNIATIVKFPTMTSRGATAVAGLVLIVLVSCLGLIPEQPPRALGIEAVIASVVALVLALRSAGHIVRFRTSDVSLGQALVKGGLGVVPIAGTLVGGLLLISEVEAGLYVVAAAIIVGFATSVTIAWVLLVEILR